MMHRSIAAEWLDTLPPGEPLAQGSRQDLDRLNAWMGNAHWMTQALKRTIRVEGPQRLAEIGAGDGKFALRVANALGQSGRGTSLLLLDRQAAVLPETCKAFKALGWNMATLHCDVFEWLEQPATETWDALMTNLFLHHFADQELRRLFCSLTQRTDTFIALEPRRSRWSLFFSLLVGCIGCNRVTRHDAPISVRAGFVGKELSTLWGKGKDWVLSEGPAGLFGHGFIARKEAGCT